MQVIVNDTHESFHNGRSVGWSGADRTRGTCDIGGMGYWSLHVENVEHLYQGGKLGINDYWTGAKWLWYGIADRRDDIDESKVVLQLCGFLAETANSVLTNAKPNCIVEKKTLRLWQIKRLVWKNYVKSVEKLFLNLMQYSIAIAVKTVRAYSGRCRVKLC